LNCGGLRRDLHRADWGDFRKHREGRGGLSPAVPAPGSPNSPGGFRREVQPRRQHWFLNRKSGFPFRTRAFCSVSRGQRRLGEKEDRAPSVTPGVALRSRTQARRVSISPRCTNVRPAALGKPFGENSGPPDRSSMAFAHHLPPWAHARASDKISPSLTAYQAILHSKAKWLLARRKFLKRSTGGVWVFLPIAVKRDPTV
jgi:hypothetical protein